MGSGRAVVAIAFFFMAGCGAAADVEPTAAVVATEDGEPAPINLEALVGSSWTLRFGGGLDGEIPLVDGWPITLTFDLFWGEDVVDDSVECSGDVRCDSSDDFVAGWRHDDVVGTAIVRVRGALDEAESFDLVDDSGHVAGADHELFSQVHCSTGVLG